MKLPHLVTLTGGVSFANKNVSGLQKYLRFQICNHAFDFSPNCTPLNSITIINVQSNYHSTAFVL
jgi:hypothetical protein